MTDLTPEQHVGDEMSQRLAETGGEFASEAGELGFQTRTNFAMLHRGRLQGRSGFFGENPSTTDSVPSHLSEMINLRPSITCTHLQQKLRKVLLRSVRHHHRLCPRESWLHRPRILRD